MDNRIFIIFPILLISIGVFYWYQEQNQKPVQWVGNLEFDSVKIRDYLEIKKNNTLFVTNDFGTFQLDESIKKTDLMPINDQTLIPWKNGTLIKWSDFNTVQKHDPSELAFTHTDVEYKPITEQNITNSSCTFIIKHVQVDAVFVKSQSWKGLEVLNLTDWNKTYVLRHEQGHFDIAEEMARKMFHEMTDEVKGVIFHCTGMNIVDKRNNVQVVANSALKSVYDKLHPQWNEFDVKYDRDTKHDEIIFAQNEYNLLFANLH